MCVLQGEIINKNMFNSEVKRLKEEAIEMANTITMLTRQNKELERENTKLNAEKVENKQVHELEIKELEHNHKLELQTKEFDMKHFKDNELKSAIDEKITLEQKIAVLTKENEMLIKITDLNADVIDVKELVNSLIKKLPEINLTSLTVAANGNGTK